MRNLLKFAISLPESLTLPLSLRSQANVILYAQHFKAEKNREEIHHYVDNSPNRLHIKLRVLGFVRGEKKQMIILHAGQ